MEYRRCSLVLVRYKPAAYFAAVLAVSVAAVALAVAAGSAAWLVVAVPIRRSERFLDSSHPPSVGFPSQGCDKPARYARAIPA